MNITRALLVLLAVAAPAPIDATPAAAQTAHCRPWCVLYGGGGGRGGSTNCGFVSFEQCMWTAQGSDFCMPNGACPPQGGWGDGGGDRALDRRHTRLNETDWGSAGTRTPQHAGKIGAGVEESSVRRSSSIAHASVPFRPAKAATRKTAASISRKG